MPTYRYKCNECGEEFTLRRSSCSRDEAVECPGCESSQVKREMSNFAVGSSTGADEVPACADGGCPFS